MPNLAANISKLNDRELGTVLAALRRWQTGVGVFNNQSPFNDIATDCGALKALDFLEIDTLCEKLNTETLQPAQIESNARRLGRFNQELLDSVETFSGLVTQYGTRTLIDLMYLKDAILNAGSIDATPPKSRVLAGSDVIQVLRKLPSAQLWLSYVNEYDADEKLVRKASPPPAEPTQIKVLLDIDGGVLQSVLVSSPDVQVVLHDLDNLESEGVGVDDRLAIWDEAAQGLIPTAYSCTTSSDLNKDSGRNAPAGS